MEADSNYLKKTKQSMRVGKNGNTTLQIYGNRFQQVLNSEIQNSEESIETEEFENSFFETTEQYDFKETEDIKEESCNPWNVESLFEFSHFCCPECEFKTSSNISKNNCRQDFVDHVSINHPWALSYLQKISDKSVKNITLCAEIKEEAMGYKMSKSEFDPNEINVVEKKLYLKDTHEINVTAKLVDDPISSMKEIDETNVSEKKVEDSNNIIEDTQENNATSNDTDLQNSMINKSEMTIKDPTPDKPKKRGRKRKNEDISQKNGLKNKAYKCETCDKSYMIYTLLQNHISIVHDRKKEGNGETAANEQQNRYE